MAKSMTGAEVRQSFINYFLDKGHAFVPSASLVPGSDQTLLFTNAGMVQFKEVFLGTDVRPYTRAVNSQKCIRVAGKHNDLDDVGRDNSHHTFFEMLGNWSFGDYYKKDAITWAWDLLTNVWGLDKSKLYATCFKDDKGSVATDEEAALNWREQPGIIQDHVLYFGRKENFWEMAETGPCGPCSEIHIDLGPDFCNKLHIPGHVCRVNGDCPRFLEIWNLVFIQYNRISANDLQPLPSTHVDTGMGLERIVAIMQGVYSNYKTDLLSPLLDKVQALTGQTAEQREANLTPYRVIADHARASAFLIGDGVVPGNTSRNYVCRMIIRRASLFGSKIGLNQPFLADVAEVVINNYSTAYPALEKNRATILNSLTREEKRFHRTLESGMNYLDDLMSGMKAKGQQTIDGKAAFDLYATHGLPLEITRDIAREQNLDVDEGGFREAMEEHRLASGAGKSFGSMGGEDVDVFREVLENLVSEGKLASSGVEYDPYEKNEIQGHVLAIVREGESVLTAREGDTVEVIMPRVVLYLESGGQVSDSGTITFNGETPWEIKLENLHKPAAGIITYSGTVVKGQPKVGDLANARIDRQRRKDIMRNHTATHLLHAELQKILGEHARQAGSFVSEEHLRFDFTHNEGLTPKQIEQVEAGVNQAILENHPVKVVAKSLTEAIAEGATALFGEKYGENVRAVSIGGDNRFSYELCGGTHVESTGDIGSFLILSEGSAAAGVRRIMAVTGRGAYELIRRRFEAIKHSAEAMGSSVDEVPSRVEGLLEELNQTRKKVALLRQEFATSEFQRSLENIPLVGSVPVLSLLIPNIDMDTMRQLTDLFRQKVQSGVVVLGSAVEGRPSLIAAVTDDLVKKGIQAGDLVKTISATIGGSGGGRPNMAQAGGKDASRLQEAIDQVAPYIQSKIK